MLLIFLFLTNSDSTLVDTAIVYEIPTILDFQTPADSIGIPHTLETLFPDTYDLSLANTVDAAPLAVFELGCWQPVVLSRRGQYPPSTRVYLNGHALEETVFGYRNLAILPIQFLDRITLNRPYLSETGVCLHTKINRYDRPFSMISYTTGSHETSQYHIDFTRPITNDYGLFLSGVYGESAGFGQNDSSEIGAAYLNMYSVPIPARLDIMFSLNDFGIPGIDGDTNIAFVESRFFDACLLFGTSFHKAAVYHTRNSHTYHDSLQGFSAEILEQVLGAETKNYTDLGIFEVQYGVTGTYSDIESNCYGSHTVRSLTANAGVTRALGRVRFSVAGRAALRDDHPLQLAPAIGFDALLIDRTYLTASVSRHFRIPSIAETTIPAVPLPQAYFLIGVDTLQTEHFWSQEIGITGHFLTVMVYRQDFTEQIVIESDENDVLMPKNSGSSQSAGIEFSFHPRVFLQGTAGEKNSTYIHLSAGGTYVFDENRPLLLPGEYARASIGIHRETPRFGCGFTAAGLYIGERTDFSGGTIEIVRSLSLAASIRFVSLSFIFRVDNIFDEANPVLPEYPARPRSYFFSIHWEFQD